MPSELLPPHTHRGTCGEPWMWGWLWNMRVPAGEALGYPSLPACGREVPQPCACPSQVPVRLAAACSREPRPACYGPVTPDSGSAVSGQHGQPGRLHPGAPGSHTPTFPSGWLMTPLARRLAPQPSGPHGPLEPRTSAQTKLTVSPGPGAAFCPPAPLGHWGWAPGCSGSKCEVGGLPGKPGGGDSRGREQRGSTRTTREDAEASELRGQRTGPGWVQATAAGEKGLTATGVGWGRGRGVQMG